MGTKDAYNFANIGQKDVEKASIHDRKMKFECAKMKRAYQLASEKLKNVIVNEINDFVYEKFYVSDNKMFASF